jgi:hypothetical protein
MVEAEMRINSGSSWMGTWGSCAGVGLGALWLGSTIAGCSGTSTVGDAGSGADAVPVVDAPAALDVPEIAGRYDEAMFSMHTIEGDRWEIEGMDFSAGFTLTVVNNGEDWAVARNDATNAFSPGLYSRFEWTMSAGSLYYCQVAFDAADEAAALAATRPDRAAPSTSGCGGFPWSLLTPVGP